MEKYNYYEIMTNDIINWLEYEEFIPSDYDDPAEWLQDELWDNDNITGNGYGYYDTEEKCEEYICHNLDLLTEALIEFCWEYNSKKLYELMKTNKLACYFDCLIRCYVLSTAIHHALEEYDKHI